MLSWALLLPMLSMLPLLAAQFTAHAVPMRCDPGGGASPAAALQACIDAAADGGEIEVPAGRYLIDRQLTISRPLTIRTAGTRGSAPVCTVAPLDCAVLVAAPEFSAENGMLVLNATSGVTLEHLVLDGNRAARTGSAAAMECLRGHNRFGFNATAATCVRCALDDVVSEHALCGTGMEWTGAGASIRRSAFLANGDATVPFLWADGLTALYAPGATITDNQFLDNSDIGLIIGHGANAFIARNRIEQRQQAAFAGLMLDNFGSDDLSARGDFRGAVITANVVDCGNRRCGFGIELGPHPWYRSRNIVGGEVSGNMVLGAIVGINIDGAGTSAAPIMVFANTIHAARERLRVPLCDRDYEGTLINVAPDSVVNRRGDVWPAQTANWHQCR